MDSLRRQSDQVGAGQLSVWWGQRLARLVAESPVGSRLTVVTQGRSGRLHIAVTASWRGDGADGREVVDRLAQEAAGLLDAIASLSVADPQEPAPDVSGAVTILRILPRGAAADVRSIGFATGDPVDRELWAGPRFPAPDELSRLLIGFPDVALVQTVEALTDQEIDDARDASIQRVIESGSALDDAVGTPVRVAATLVVLSGDAPVPLRLREHVRGWFTVLDLDEARTVPEWGQGTVAPEHVAAGLLRFPVATAASFPGLLVEPARVPIDGPDAVAQGIRIGRAVDMSGADVPVRLSSEVLSRHVHVIGETGTGKSTLLSAMAVETALRGEGLVLLDPHGATVERVVSELPREARDRTWVIRCGDQDDPVRLNPFAVADPALQDLLISDLVDAFQSLFDPLNQGIVGPRFQHTMRHVLMTIASVRGQRASLLDVPRLLTDKTLREAFLERVTDEDTLTFWRNDIIANRSSDLNEVIAWISAKFTSFASNRVVTEMLSTGTDSFDPAEAMSQDRIILIDLGKGSVGATGARILGLIYLLRFWSAALTREDPHPFTLLVDEAHSLSALSLPSILAEGRKFGLRAVLAHQYLGQLDPRLAEALRGSAGSRICFRVGQADARELALSFGPEFDVTGLTGLPQSVAAVRVADSGRSIRPFSLKVDHTTAYVPPADAREAAADIEARSRALLVDPFRDARRVQIADLGPLPATDAPQVLDPADAPLDPLAREGGGPAVQTHRRLVPTSHLMPARILLADDLDEARAAFLIATTTAQSPDADADVDVAAWEDALAWAGLGLLPLAAREGLARCAHHLVSTRVGRRLVEESPADAWKESESLFDTGSTDPLFPLRDEVDIAGIVASERRRLVDLLVLSREEIRAAAVDVSDTPGSRSDDLGVIAEMDREDMRRRVGDHSPPDDAWVASARSLIDATREMDPAYAVSVALAVLDELPHPAWFGSLLETAWLAWSCSPASSRRAHLGARLCGLTNIGEQLDQVQWSCLLEDAEGLLSKGAKDEALDIMAFALGHPMSGRVPPAELVVAWTQYAAALESAQRISTAASAFATAASLAADGQDLDSARSLLKDADRCRGLIGLAPNT